MENGQVMTALISILTQLGSYSPSCKVEVVNEYGDSVIDYKWNVTKDGIQIQLIEQWNEFTTR